MSTVDTRPTYYFNEWIPMYGGEITQKISYEAGDGSIGRKTTTSKQDFGAGEGFVRVEWTPYAEDFRLWPVRTIERPLSIEESAVIWDSESETEIVNWVTPYVTFHLFGEYWNQRFGRDEMNTGLIFLLKHLPTTQLFFREADDKSVYPAYCGETRSLGTLGWKPIEDDPSRVGRKMVMMGWEVVEGIAPRAERLLLPNDLEIFTQFQVQINEGQRELA